MTHERETANRGGIRGITPPTGPGLEPGYESSRMPNGGVAAMSRTTARSRGIRALVSIAATATLVGACSGAASPAVSSEGPTTLPSQIAAATTAATLAPTVPTASPLPSLKVLWQGAGPVTAKGLATYWPTVNPITKDIWVAASRQNQYWIFSPAGKFLEAWGTAGSGPGQLALTTHDPTPDSVGAIAFAPDGSFYIADNGNYRVEKFDKNRKFVLQWGSFGSDDGQFGSPKGIATDGKSVWVADDPRADVQVFDANGTFLRKFSYPTVLFSHSAAGTLYGLNPTGVLEVDGSGQTIRQLHVDWAALRGASDVVADGSGHLFVGTQDDNGPTGLAELDATTGAILNYWSNGAETLAISPDGKTLYLAYGGPPDGGWPYIQAVALP